MPFVTLCRKTPHPPNWLYIFGGSPRPPDRGAVPDFPNGIHLAFLPTTLSAKELEMSVTLSEIQSIHERVRRSGSPIAGDEVVCFASGKRINRSDAVRVPLGNTLHVWISKAFCREG